METKKCNNCNIIKPLTEYQSNGYSKKGIKTYKPFCKYCNKILVKNKLKPEIIIIKGKVYEKESEAMKRLKESKKKYYENNKQKILDYKKKFYEELETEKKKKIIKRVCIMQKKRLVN